MAQKFSSKNSAIAPSTRTRGSDVAALSASLLIAIALGGAIYLQLGLGVGPSVVAGVVALLVLGMSHVLIRRFRRVVKTTKKLETKTGSIETRVTRLERAVGLDEDQQSGAEDAVSPNEATGADSFDDAIAAAAAARSMEPASHPDGFAEEIEKALAAAKAAPMPEVEKAPIDEVDIAVASTPAVQTGTHMPEPAVAPEASTPHVMQAGSSPTGEMPIADLVGDLLREPTQNVPADLPAPVATTPSVETIQPSETIQNDMSAATTPEPVQHVTAATPEQAQAPAQPNGPEAEAADVQDAVANLDEAKLDAVNSDQTNWEQETVTHELRAVEPEDEGLTSPFDVSFGDIAKIIPADILPSSTHPQADNLTAAQDRVEPQLDTAVAPQLETPVEESHEQVAPEQPIPVQTAPTTGEATDTTTAAAETPVAPVAIETEPAADPATQADVVPVVAAPAATPAPSAEQTEQAPSAPLLSPLELAVQGAITTAISNKHVDLFLQPVLSIKERKVQFYEVLSRLPKADGSHYTGADFIPVAEKTNVISRLDHIALLRAIQVVRRLSERSSQRALFCNLSTQSLADPGFFSAFLRYLNENRALTEGLIFEFRQDQFDRTAELQRSGLHALADMGYRFSLDNITNLNIEAAELRAQNFHFVKVNARDFVEATGDQDPSSKLAEFHERMAKAGVRVVVEKIESEQTLAQIAYGGVDLGQGNLFAEPRAVKADVFETPAQPQRVTDAA